METTLKGITITSIEEGEGIVKIEAIASEGVGICEGCGVASDKVHGWHTVGVRDIPYGGKGVIVELKKRNFECINVGCEVRTFMQQVEGVKKGKRRSEALRGYIVRRYVRMPAGDVVDEVREEGEKIGESTVYRDFEEWVKEKREEERGSRKEVKRIGIDDFKRGKGYRLGSVIVDLERSKIIGIEDKRTKKAVRKLLSLVEKDKVEVASIDMNKYFYGCCKDELANAEVVIDRFHVVDETQEALKKVINKVKAKIKDEKKRKYLWRERWVILKNSEKLDKKIEKKRKRAIERQRKAEEKKQKTRKGKTDKEVLKELLSFDDSLAYAYEKKEELRKFYDAKSFEEAEFILANWIDEVKKCQIKELVKVAKTYQRWKEPILNYFKVDGIDKTNGKTERQVENIKDIEKARHKFDLCENLEGIIFLRQERKVVHS